MKSPKVHYISNRSTMDDRGRMLRFLTNTFCGKRLTVPRLLTDERSQVTCKACLRVTKRWERS